MSKYTKEELAEYKEKFLIIVQDTFAAFMIGMIEIHEFLNMVVIMSSMLHGIYHENGERTWKCETDDHSYTFDKIDRLYDGIMKDRKKDNDIISWIDDPEKAAQLQGESAQKIMGMTQADKAEDEGPVSGHLH